MTNPTPVPSFEARRERDILLTLFDLGRQVTSVLAIDELIEKVPGLIARVVSFKALALYLLDGKRQELRVAYSVGYPDEGRDLRLKVGEGLVGTAVATRQPILANDVAADPRYVAAVPGMASELVVPLSYKSCAIGALNLLSERTGQFTELDLSALRQFGAHLAVALQNATLFDRERKDAEAFETLAEIGRDAASILDLEELLTRLVHLARRVIDYRTFGIFLVDDASGALELKVAVKYGEKIQLGPLAIGRGLVGQAALLKAPVLVPDVSTDPRYLKVVEDVRSELAVPMLLQDRCIGVFDLESPELDAFDKRDVEIVSLLASQAAVAVQNARLYEAVRSNEKRLEREVKFAQRVQAALLPGALPRKMKGVDVGARFEAALELGGDFHDFLSPDPHVLVVALGDVSGKGVPAALYSAFAGELVRGRTFRRRLAPEQAHPAAVLSSINTILHERQLEEYYCTLCYAAFDLKRRVLTLANSGLPYPVRCRGDRAEQIELPGVPLGAFAGTSYEELSIPLETRDLFVFCSDGVFEAMDPDGREFGATRLIEVVERTRGLAARAIVDAIFDTVEEFRQGAPPNDDMTAVAVSMTG